MTDATNQPRAVSPAGIAADVAAYLQSDEGMKIPNRFLVHRVVERWPDLSREDCEAALKALGIHLV